MNPSEIRKHLRKTRNALSNTTQKNHAQLALKHFIQLLNTNPSFNTPQNIALFLSQDGELNTKEVIDYLWHETAHQVYLPVLETRPEWHMAFVEYTEHTPMQANEFNIQEPKAPLNEHLTGEQMDWVIMPLVGFDLQGNRLGMGGGYYDRTFAFKQTTTQHSTKLIGWAHQCQQVKQLPREPWDIPLDGVMTESGYRHW